MSERKTKRLSGAQYRQQKQRKVEEQKKLKGSLDNFFIAAKGMENKSQDYTADNIPSADLAVPSTSREKSSEESYVPPAEPIFEVKDQNTSIAYTCITSDNKDNEQIALLSNDPGKWPEKLNVSNIQFLTQNYPQQISKIFPRNSSGRKFSAFYYYRSLTNGEKVHRQWLLYSESLDSVICGPCRLFEEKINRDDIAGTKGVNDWGHISLILKRHEYTADHIKNVKKMSELLINLQHKTTIDATQQRLYDIEKKTLARCNRTNYFSYQIFVETMPSSSWILKPII